MFFTLFQLSLQNSPLRELYIVLSFLSIGIGLEIAGILFYRAFNYRISAKFSSRIFLAFGILLVGYSLGLASITVQRFVLSTYPLWYNFFYFQAWFFIGIGGFGACLILERLYQKSLKTKYVFSLISGTFLIINWFAWMNFNINYYGLGVFFTINVFLAIFFGFLVKRSSGSTRVYVVQNLIGFCMYVFNFLFANFGFFQLIYRESFFIVTYCVQFIGINILFYSFYRISVLVDMDWREVIEELYVISKSRNETVYYYNFRQPRLRAKEIYAGGILGVHAILNNLSQGVNEVDEIDQGDNILVLDHSSEFIAVLVVRYRFRYHFQIVKEIVREFEKNYAFLFQSCQLDCSNTSLFDGFITYIHNILYKP